MNLQGMLRGMSGLRVISRSKRVILIIFHSGRVIVGLLRYSFTSNTTHRAFRSLRQLTPLTGGRSNALASCIVRRFRPPLELGIAHGSLGIVDAGGAAMTASIIARHGFVVFGERLSPEVCDEVRAWAETAPCLPRPTPVGAIGPLTFRDVRGSAPVFDVDTDALMSLPAVQLLAVDRTFHAVAQAYLGSEVVNDSASMWWSAPSSGADLSAAAQLFHYDMSRPNWLKFFVYLTDVTETSGPHVYVRGSHRSKPGNLWRDGRRSDAEIVAVYGEADVVPILGPAGTMFAADTIGFHKGEAVTDGERLVFQLEYSNTLFGDPEEAVATAEISQPDAVGEVRSFPRPFRRFKVRQD